MFADIFTKKNNRKFSICVLNSNDKQIMTTIPTLKNNSICFLPNDEIFISIPFSDSIQMFEVSFNHIQKINDSYFFVFDIMYHDEKENIRREKRIHTDTPAILRYAEQDDFSFADILDISQNGFKIETKTSLKRKVFNLSFEEEADKINKRVKVAWVKKSGNSYQYGLQTVH